MIHELRCDAKKHGELVTDDEETVIECKCSSVFCGAAPGVVVIHQFDHQTGKLLDTKRYRDLVNGRQGNSAT